METKKTADYRKQKKNSPPPENKAGEEQMGFRENRDHTTAAKMSDKRTANDVLKQEQKKP